MEPRAPFYSIARFFFPRANDWSNSPQTGDVAVASHKREVEMMSLHERERQGGRKQDGDGAASMRGDEACAAHRDSGCFLGFHFSPSSSFGLSFATLVCMGRELATEAMAKGCNGGEGGEEEFVGVR